jgi:hypothetical protein
LTAQRAPRRPWLPAVCHQTLLAHGFETVHAPGNNGNTNWGRCTARAAATAAATAATAAAAAH